MKESKERLKYKNDFAKEHYKRVQIVIKNEEKNVIKKLESVNSISEYIVDLIRADVRREVLREKRKERLKR
jgi:hypothetical protein